MAVKFNNTFSPQFTARWWNAFNPDQQLPPFAGYSSVVNQFDVGLLPDQALENLTGNARTMVRTPLGDVEVPEYFTPAVDKPIDQPPSATQSAQVLVESGIAYTGNRDAGYEHAYECSALRAGLVVYQYDDDLAVISQNYELILNKYRTQVDQIISMYVRKCNGRFRKSFQSAAMIGALDAINSFDSSRGRFPSWLIQCVHFAINNSASEVLGVSRTAIADYRAVKKTRVRFRQKYNRDPADDELRFVLGVTEYRIKRMCEREAQVRGAYKGVSFDETFMGVPTSREADAAIGNDEECLNRARKALERTRRLSEKEKRAVERYFFSSDRPNFKAIGVEEGIGLTGVGARINRALQKMERVVPGIGRAFESIRPRKKKSKIAKSRSGRDRQSSLRGLAAKKYIVEILDPEWSSAAVNYFNRDSYRALLWDLSFQERRVLQYRIEGNTGEDIAGLEGGAITGGDAESIFSAALRKLFIQTLRLDNPEITRAEINERVKRFEVQVGLSEFITDGESPAYLSANPEEFSLLLSVLTDRQRRAIELRLSGLSFAEMGVEMEGIRKQVAYNHFVGGREALKVYLQAVGILRAKSVEINRENILAHESRVELSAYLTDNRNPYYCYDHPKEYQLLLSLLTGRQKEAMELHLAGLFESQVAKRMGVYLRAAQVSIATGKEHLKRYFQAITFLRSRRMDVTRESILAYWFNVELSHYITGNGNRYFVYSERFEVLRGELSQILMDVIRFKQFEYPGLTEEISLPLIASRCDRAKIKLKKAYQRQSR